MEPIKPTAFLNPKKGQGDPPKGKRKGKGKRIKEERTLRLKEDPSTSPKLIDLVRSRDGVLEIFEDGTQTFRGYDGTVETATPTTFLPTAEITADEVDDSSPSLLDMLNKDRSRRKVQRRLGNEGVRGLNELYRAINEKRDPYAKYLLAPLMTMAVPPLGAGTGVAAGLGRTAQMIGRGLNAPIAGVPGLTGSNVLGAYGASDFLTNRARRIPREIKEGNYSKAAEESVMGALDLMGVGISPALRGAAKKAYPYLSSKADDFLSPRINLSKYNPKRFQPQAGKYYRQVGKPAIDDAFETGVIRGKKEKVDDLLSMEGARRFNEEVRTAVSTQERNQSFRHGDYPYFERSKFHFQDRPSRGSYLIETGLPAKNFTPSLTYRYKFPSPNYNPRTKKFDIYNPAMFDLSTGTPEPRTVILNQHPNIRKVKSDFTGEDQYTFYRPHFWKGYTKMDGPKPKLTSSKKSSNKDAFKVDKVFEKGDNESSGIKAIKVEGKSGYIGIERNKDAGDNAWRFSAKMTNPVEAGKGFMKMNKMFPGKKPIISEPTSLSLDSYPLLLNMGKRKDWESTFDGYVSLNYQAQHNKLIDDLKGPVSKVSYRFGFDDVDKAKEALSRVNKLLKDKGIKQKARLTARGSRVKGLNKTFFGIEIPNFKLQRKYKAGGSIPRQSVKDNFSASLLDMLNRRNSIR